MIQSKRITDGLIFGILFLVLLFISLFIPFTLMIGIFLLPIPFVLYTFRHQYVTGIIMLLATAGVALIFIPVSFPLTIAVGIGGIVIGMSIAMNTSPYETWARGSIGFIGGLLFIFLFSQLFWQINWADEIDQLVQESIAMSEQIASQFGDAEALKALEEQFSLFKDLIPAIISLTGIVLAVVTQWISYQVINRLEQRMLKFPPFRNFNLPAALIWIYLFAIIGMVLLSEPSNILYTISYNVFIIVGFLIALQGFSFIFFFSDHRQISRVLPITSIILSILFPFIFLYLVRILGIIDIGFHLKNRLTRGS